jgi:hypothetical protein
MDDHNMTMSVGLQVLLQMYLELGVQCNLVTTSNIKVTEHISVINNPKRGVECKQPLKLSIL